MRYKITWSDAGRTHPGSESISHVKAGSLDAAIYEFRETISNHAKISSIEEDPEPMPNAAQLNACLDLARTLNSELDDCGLFGLAGRATAMVAEIKAIKDMRCRGVST